jgi:anti-sigma factor (TIGR02949 family)
MGEALSTIETYDCREAFRRIHDYVDRELAADEIERVRAHLDVCAMCAREFLFEQQVIDDLRARLRRVSAPAGLIATVMSRLDRELPRSES